MEFTFTWKRVLLFAGCMLVFGLLGGFSNPIPESEYFSTRRVTKAWFYCIALFTAGAGSVSLVDHVVGLMDRTNIRWLYVILGVLLMGSALIWLHVLRSAVENS